MTGRLVGETALVTGVAGGIGAAIARRFLAEGAYVVGLDMAEPTPQLAIDGLPIIRLDICDRPAVDRAITEVVSAHGKLDILVHAAARLGGSGPFLSITTEDWDAYIRTNLTGSFHIAQAAARAMTAGGIRGRIVLIGSVNSFAAEPGAAPYVASKGGVRLLAKAMAVDLASHGISVNLIAPGPITVPRNAALFASGPLRRSFRRQIPAGGPGSPDEVAEAALFLAERRSGFVTGAEIAVDGGLLAQILPPE
jgi:NAD(P)-dependent dehydrogenase (short-subunit alcohol dehydrogenase family)